VSSLNNLRIIGNLGNNAIIHSTDKGQLYCTFRVAVNSGTPEHKHVEWFNCIAWGLMAQKCQEFKKGQLVFLEGPLKTNTYKRIELNIQNVIDFTNEQQKVNGEEMPSYLDEIPDMPDSLVD
jgi:single-stranded DNA-binding protein